MVRPSVEAASVSIVQGTPEEKRRRGGALQNRADVRGRVEVAIASWSAGVLSRFREGPALSRDRERLDRPGHARRKAPQGGASPKPGGRSRDRGQRASVLECGSPVPLSRWIGPQSRPGAARSSRAQWSRRDAPPLEFCGLGAWNFALPLRFEL